MRVIIDILHPAHVHMFKHFAREMADDGHTVLFTARDKDNSVALLRREGFDPIVLSSHRPGALNLAAELVGRTRAFIRVARDFQPDVLTGVMGPTIALAGTRLGIPSIVFYDTEIAHVSNRWVYPLATAVVTPRAYRGSAGRRHVRYDGYQSLAHLHPSRFTPDPGKLEPAGLSADDPYVFFRFVAFDSSHDAHESGMSAQRRIDLVERAARIMRVVISSERPLPPQLAEHAYRGRIEDIHHVVALAHMTVSESATMASESAILGTPVAYIATTDRGYLAEQEQRYGLVRIFGDDEQDRLEQFVLEQLTDPTLTRRASEGRALLLDDTIDTTAFMIELFQQRFGQ